MVPIAKDTTVPGTHSQVYCTCGADYVADVGHAALVSLQSTANQAARQAALQAPETPGDAAPLGQQVRARIM